LRTPEPGSSGAGTQICGSGEKYRLTGATDLGARPIESFFLQWKAWRMAAAAAFNFSLI